MGDSMPTIRAAIVQDSPVYLDREASLKKACKLIKEAGNGGAEIVAFNEGFIPGHPLWYHFHPATAPSSREMAHALFQNSVEIPGVETDALCAAAREARTDVVIGLCEKVPGTLGTMYNTQLFINSRGEIIGKHQKLTPTVGERLVHTGGYGDTLKVYQADSCRVTGLICGESSNPLSLFSLLMESPTVFVIAWPNLPGRKMLNRADRALVAGRSVAFMTKSYVLNCCGTVTDRMREMLAYTDEDRQFLSDKSLSGGSSIVAPNGEVLAGPLGSEDAILYADLDLEQCVDEKLIHDLAGHYNRADIFKLLVNRERPELCSSSDNRQREKTAERSAAVEGDLPEEKERLEKEDSQQT